MNRLLFFAAALFFCGPLAPGVSAQIPSQEARVTLNVAERPLELVVQFLREKSGANIEIIDGMEEADKISTAVVDSLQLVEVHWEVALEIAAEKVGAIVEQRPGGVWIITKPPRVYYDAKDQEIADVIDLIARQVEANVVIAPEVVGTVSVRFNGVPWREALEVLAKTRGFTVVEEKGGVLRIVDPIVLQDQLVTKSYQLRYLRPPGTYRPLIKSEFISSRQVAGSARGGAAGQAGGQVSEQDFTVLRALRKALSAAGEMDYIEVQNVVLLRDTQQVHEMIREILDTLDVEPAQIFCDVKFVSTLNSNTLNLGVDYGDRGPQASFGGGQIPITFPFNAGSGGFEDLLIASPDGHGPYVDPALNASANTVIPDTIFGALSFTGWQGTLRLLQRDLSAEVIQAPKIITLDGVEATIFVGETVRYAEAKSEQGQAGGLQLTIQEATNSPVDVGFQLLIKPNVIPGTDNVRMEVIPKETSLSGTGDSALAPEGFDVFTIGAVGLEGSIALPRTRSSTIVTTMMVPSGQTAVIGGLSTDTDTQVETRVPGLWRIPLLGELFKHRSNSRDRRNLMVFLTPSIVKTAGDHQRLFEQEVERRRAFMADELDSLLGEEAAIPPEEPAPD